MKAKNNIYILYILLVFLSCKKSNNTIEVNEEKKIVEQFDSVHKTKTQNDIYINNEYNVLTELVDVRCLESKETTIDSIWYGLYEIRNSEGYIFAVDKCLSNYDSEKYKTLDTVNLKSKNIEVKVEIFSNYKTLNLLLNKQLVKKWNFKTYPNRKETISIFSKWVADDLHHIPALEIRDKQVYYYFSGQCLCSFDLKKLNDNEVELIWGKTASDCNYDTFFNEKFNLPQDKIPQSGKTFAKYTVYKGVLRVTYYYQEWVDKYKEKMIEEDVPFPFVDSFILKKEEE